MSTVEAELGPEARYFAALREGRFEVQVCRSCAAAVFYPRVSCPECGSGQLAWMQPTGKGVVYSTCVIRQPPKDGPSYNVALIDLDFGARLMARVEGANPEEVRIGDRVKARISGEGDTPVLVFDLDQEESK